MRGTLRKRIWPVLRENPVPVVALVGLISGLGLWFAVRQEDAATLVWYAALLLGGAPVVWSTVRGMLRGHFASDVVAMLAIVAAIIMDEPFAGVLVVLMQSGGEALEKYGFRRASSSLTSLLARAPRRAWRRRGAELTDIDVGDVQPGELLVVRPGELIPVDGTLLSDRAEIDEAALTGEALPHPKEAGASLLSGSVNTAGAFEMRADALSSQSQYARIVQLVRQAQEEKAPIMRLADQYAVWFTPLTLLMAGFGWFVTGDPHTIVAVLVVATPCPLILATPIAVISGINRAAQQSIIVKGGTAIEQVGRARAVAFDKTGTLTLGIPTLTRIVSANGRSPDELLATAASVEQLSSHLLGTTMLQAAQARGRPLALPEQFEEMAGRGVVGRLDGQQILVGSYRFLQERLDRGEHATLARLNAAASCGAVLSAFVAVAGRAEGVVLFSDQLRPGVPALMQRLKTLGVQRTVMLTGDRAENARPVAAAAGVDELLADLLPGDKVAAVRQWAAKYDPLVMVGDGINDAPALATAAVGIAMGARGSGISGEAAAIVLLVDDIALVGEAIAIGQHTLHIARQSIYVGLGVSFGLMIIASFGWIPAPVGAVCQEVLDVAVILNALRAR